MTQHSGREQKSDLRYLAYLILMLVLSVVVSRTVFAGTSEHHPMRFDHITLADGLSQSTVLAVLQDSKGLLWIGTENGLNRYNGYEFETFKRERGNPDSLSSDFIFDIEEDRAGNLWIATNGGGLVKFDRATNRFATFRHDPAKSNSISSNIVRRILIDAKGIIWIGTRGAGLDRLDPGSGVFSRFQFGNGDEAPNNIYALFQDSTGILWAGGDHGLTRLSTETNEVFTYAHDPDASDSLAKHSVRAIAEDANGVLWVGSDGGGIARLSANDEAFEHFVHSEDDAATLSSNRVSTLFKDSDGRLWAGTTRGLNLVDHSSGAAARYAHDSADASSLGGDDVTTIYEDRGGLLWVGTKTQGLNKWNPRTWSYGFEPAKEITASAERQPNVTSFVEDDAGTLWVGTFGDGLNAMDRASGDIVRYRNEPSSAHRIGDDRVMSLMRDRKGRIWVGTMTAGISRLDPRSGENRVFTYDPSDEASLSANGVMTMYEDSAGRVWIGTFGGGVSRFDPATEQFTRFNADAKNPASLSSDRITSFAEDQTGQIWIGTEGGGLNLFNPTTEVFYHFGHDPEDPKTLAADTVYSINVDAAGTVWVGTHGGGLDRVVGDVRKPSELHFANVSQYEGLSNDVVYGVQFDNTGWLWMSTNYGISRLDPESGEIRNLHRKDGLQSEEFNFGAHYRSADGELFFGGHNGFNAFRPEEIQVNATVPLIALTGFFNANDPSRSGLPGEDETVEISWKDDNVAFEFAALDFAAPEQNRYMYKLEGFDRDWIDLGNRRRVTYTDLDDGRYLLRVKAANSEGVWNEAGYAIPVSVSAAPWDTWWAYLGYAVLAVQLAAFLWLGHRRKIQREEKYSRRLEHEVDERTDKLLEKNKQLRHLNQALQESSLSDPLTGLRNRRFVFEEVSHDLEVVRRRIEDERDGASTDIAADLVFMMIDMDNFKPINDTYGHAAGDQVLLDFRDLLLSICRRSDFVIRWGGDEFVVIAKQARAGETEALAERIRSTVANHNFTLSDGQIVRTTCSIGFAAYPLFRNRVDESGLDQIINLADNLMYEAKRKRDAWVGMMGPGEAATSFDFDHESIEPTSLLFRARHTGNLVRHGSTPAEDHNLPRIGRVS
jgi:diguanylate cyclase (GGDEF)-like protein